MPEATSDSFVSVYEVGPRDGLQNETTILPVATKILLIQELIAAGIRRMEATSFVSPAWVPQLADADELCAQLPRKEGVSYSALCPNKRGLERALSARVPEVAVFVSASETHNKKNVNKSIAETLVAFQEVVGPATSLKLRVRGYVSTVWGCPYEGAVAPEAALRIAHQLRAMGCYQISLGDTIGIGNPRQTRDIVGLFLKEFAPHELALHMHDTRGSALANIVVAIDAGIRDFDASIGGMGGCPYAPGAAGNVATEDLVTMLHGMGLTTGLDEDRLIEAALYAERAVGRALPGKVHVAGRFVPRGISTSQGTDA